MSDMDAPAWPAGCPLLAVGSLAHRLLAAAKLCAHLIFADVGAPRRLGYRCWAG